MTEPTPSSRVPAALEVQGITKRFGALNVLRGVDLTLGQGEVLGLVGDNGAGKSTLVKILCGYQQQDGGRVLLEGREVGFRSVGEARANGIETVYQDLALIPQLPVYQNLFLGHEITRLGPIRFLDKRKMRTLSRQYLDDIKVDVPSVNAETDQLSGGSGRRSPSPEPCAPRGRSCCWTSRSRPWARASRASSSTSSRISHRAGVSRSS